MQLYLLFLGVPTVVSDVFLESKNQTAIKVTWNNTLNSSAKFIEGTASLGYFPFIVLFPKISVFHFNVIMLPAIDDRYRQLCFDFFSFSSDTFEIRIKTSASKGYIVFTDLKPYTKYSIVLQGFDEIGPGPPSKVLTKCTSPGTPTLAPNITLLSVTNSSAILRFHAPNVSQIADVDRDKYCPGSLMPLEYLNGPFVCFKVDVLVSSGQAAATYRVEFNLTSDFHVSL